MASLATKPKKEDDITETSDEIFDVARGSDETFDNICDACVHEKHLEAKAYCVDCCQYLCNGCHRTHGRLKATKGHKILTGDELIQVHRKGSPSIEHVSRSQVHRKGSPSIEHVSRSQVHRKGSPSIEHVSRSQVHRKGSPSIEHVSRSQVHRKGSPSIEHVSRRCDRLVLVNKELRSSGETLNKTHTKSGPSFQPSGKAKDVENVEDFDTGSVEVCGIEITTNGYLLICNHGNRTVSLFDTQFRELSKVRLSSAPWSIALLSPMNQGQNLSGKDNKTSSDVLLSFPDEFRLQYVKIENTKTLALGRNFKTSVGFRRIIRYKDDLIALSEDSHSHTFSVVDRRGNIKQTIRREMQGSGMFKTVYFMALSKDNNILYVTDLYNGCFGFSMLGDVVFTYRGGGINDYVGVATDTDGFVYISGPDTDTILMVNSEGKKVKDLVKIDGMKPGLMTYDSLQNKLFVKEFFGSRIFVFTLAQY